MFKHLEKYAVLYITLTLASCTAESTAVQFQDSIPSVDTSSVISSEHAEQNSSTVEYTSPILENALNLSEDFIIEGNPFEKSAQTLSKKTLLLNGQMQTLTPIQTTSTDFAGYSYDIYSDSYGNMYGTYAGTNVFCYYQRNVDTVTLGNTEVNVQSALSVAKKHLNDLGYNVDQFNIEHSNEFSYDFTINYKYNYSGIPTGEKIILHLAADHTGAAYLTSFKAYDYGRYSQDNRFANNKIVVQDYITKRDVELSEKQVKNQNNISSHFWKDKNNTLCLRTVIILDETVEYLYTYL